MIGNPFGTCLTTWIVPETPPTHHARAILFRAPAESDRNERLPCASALQTNLKIQSPNKGNKRVQNHTNYAPPGASNGQDLCLTRYPSGRVTAIIEAAAGRDIAVEVEVQDVA